MYLCSSAHARHTTTALISRVGGYALLCLLLWVWSTAGVQGQATNPPAGASSASVDGDAGRFTAWPFFRYDARRTGRSPNLGPDHPVESWRFEASSPIYSSPALGADGTIYIASYEGHLYAVSPEGDARLLLQAGGEIVSSPAVDADGTVYVGSFDGNLYAVDPDGNTRVVLQTDGEIVSSPLIVDDGTVYVGSFDGNLYAVDPNGNTRVALQTNGEIISSPAIAEDGTVYVGSTDGRLYGNSPNTERRVWDLGSDIVSSPAIDDDGMIYIGTLGGDLFVIDPDDPTPRSILTADAEIVSSPAIGGDNTIYVGSFDGNVYALGPGGARRWTLSIGEPVASSPAVDANGIIYFGSFDGNLYAVGPEGGRKWALATRRPIWSSPVVGLDQMIYIASTDTTEAGTGLLTAVTPAPAVITFRRPPVVDEPQPVDIDDLNGSSSSGTIHYRRGGEREYLPLPFTDSATIPAEFVTERGIEYWIELADGSTIPGVNPEDNPLVERVVVDNLAAKISLQAREYHMVSVPIDLLDPDIEAVLEDDYGSPNPVQWRLHRWNASDDEYISYPGLSDTFVPGNAFFLVTSTGDGFDIDNGLSVDTSTPYTITLPPQSWTQVGNPFDFCVAWQDVTFDPTTVNRNQIHYYDGTEWLGVSEESGLRPWEGYLVWNNREFPVQMQVPARETVGVCGEGNEGPEALLAADGTIFRLEARMPGTPLRDTQNWIGFRPGATPGIDSLDFREAPPPGGPHLRLTIDEHDGVAYSASFKPPGPEGRRWDFELQTSDLPAGDRRRSVEVALHQAAGLLGAYRIAVIDQDEQRRLPLVDGRFTVDLRKDTPVRHLSVLIGTEGFVGDLRNEAATHPLTYALAQNYPNPFNPETTIRYEISDPQRVQVRIFNVLGEQVQTLVDRVQEPGRYTVTWDGTDPSGASVGSGLYLYRLTAGPFTATRRMVLLR